MSSASVERHRVYTDPQDRFIFEIDVYPGPVLVAHIRFFDFCPSALKSALSNWRVFRDCVTSPLVCWGEAQDDKWERFVRMFGFRPTGHHIICNNGERRELFIHKVPS